MNVTAENLNSVMEFEHVIMVGADLKVQDTDLYAPETYGEDLMTSKPWELLDGFTGQYSYNGPVMHESEFIGGGLARHILSTPGYYVAVTISDVNEDEPYGWAVAYMPLLEER